jgi:hypothetical protein
VAIGLSASQSHGWGPAQARSHALPAQRLPARHARGKDHQQVKSSSKGNQAVRYGLLTEFSRRLRPRSRPFSTAGSVCFVVTLPAVLKGRERSMRRSRPVTHCSPQGARTGYETFAPLEDCSECNDKTDTPSLFRHPCEDYPVTVRRFSKRSMFWDVTPYRSE